MTIEAVRQFLARKPFEPYIIRLTTGEAHIIDKPRRVVAMETRIFAALTGRKSVFIPVQQIASLESLNAVLGH